MTINFAGISTELHLALVATFLWGIAEPGMLKSIAFFVATTGWISSLLINISPFMRFDGYYVFADYLKIENLQPGVVDRIPDQLKTGFQDGTILGFAIGDDYRLSVQQYTATLEDGSSLPSWVRVDPSTGQTIVQFPDGINAINVNSLMLYRLCFEKRIAELGEVLFL